MNFTIVTKDWFTNIDEPEQALIHLLHRGVYLGDDAVAIGYHGAKADDTLFDKHFLTIDDVDARRQMVCLF